jgi:F-type H+-transporting ATPase subunit gamma
MAGTKEIRRRIRSITNTKKITKAMELVSASKMRKAVNNVLATRSYANLAWRVVLDLAGKTESQYHPLLEKRPLKKIGIILISSNRGLCGGFNGQIAAKVVREIKKYEKENIAVELITLGKRGRDIARKSNANLIADFIKQDLTVSITQISALSHLILENFINGTYDSILLAYTDFISSITQKPVLKKLLPLETELDENLGVIGRQQKIDNRKQTTDDNLFEYIFEPTTDEVLEKLLPRLIEMQIYQAVLESDASEHSARMMAMRNASDAAVDMIDDLTLAFNQARQAGITREIAEIAGGKAALE